VQACGRSGEGVWQQMGWDGGFKKGSKRMVEQQVKVARQLDGRTAEQSNDNSNRQKRAGEDGRSVPKGAAGAAREFYKTNIAACRTDGTSRKMLDYCRCRLQRECDSRVQPLAPFGKARTEVHSGALVFHAYAGRDSSDQDHPAWQLAPAAAHSAQWQYLDVQRVVVFRRLPCSVLLLLPRLPRPRPSLTATSTATVRVC
jgi:hypothetical protein